MSNLNNCERSWGRYSNSFAMPQKRYRATLETSCNDRQYFDEEYECNSYSRGCHCSECCRKRRTCNCERGKIYNRAVLKGLQLQLQSNTMQTITNGANVIFNTEISRQSPYITYNNITGLVTIRKSGVYHIEWWTATEGILAGTDTGVTFSIITSAGHNIKASSPITVGQIVGNALIEIFASYDVPVTLRLVNQTNGTVGLAQTQVKANLIVSNIINEN